MKKRWIFAGVMLALGVTFVLGPTTRVAAPNLAALAQQIPADLSQLDAYLADKERQVPSLRPDTEKKITWVNGPTKTPYAVIYLHGFSATRQETTPLSQDVAKALGANLFETRLTGHGQDGEAFAQATAGAWLADTFEAFLIGQRLGEKVIVLGTSTGSTLALWLAMLPEEQRKGLWAMALLSPNLGPKDPTAAILTYPWANVLLPLAIPSRSWEPKSEAQARYWTTSYPSPALFPMQALVEYVRGLDTKKLTTPTLFIYNQKDEVIDADRVSAFYQKMPGPKRQMLIQAKPEEDSHVIAGAILSPSQTAPITKEILQFISSLE